MNNWFRPSIQQPRWIKQAIDKITFPVLYTQQIIKEYWDTWHKVFKPESKHEDQQCATHVSCESAPYPCEEE